MDIIEAVGSGKNFRRPGGPWFGDYTSITISKEAIMATDWEVEERKIEITESEFMDKCGETLKQLEFQRVNFHYPLNEFDFIKDLVKRLFGK